MFVCFFRQRLKVLRKRGKSDDKHRQRSDEEEGDDEDDDEDDDDDSVDSDFSIDEDDEPRSDLEDEAKAADFPIRTRPKRGQGVQTKAYKEPQRDKDKKIIRDRSTNSIPSSSKEKKKSPSKPQLSVPASASPKKASGSSHSKWIGSADGSMVASAVRKLTRATTVTKTAETAKRQKERLVQHRKLLKRRAQLAAARKDEMRPLTQAEILEEAKITEKLNLESLKRFQEMELEAKKKARISSKRSLKGAYISYRSTSMPLIQEVSRNGNIESPALGNSEDRICVDDNEDEEANDVGLGKEESDVQTDRLQHTEERSRMNEGSDRRLRKGGDDDNEMRFRVDSRVKQERTFVTFSDYDTFRQSFPGQKGKPPVRHPIQQKVCPITRLPAKYFDPVTRLPYANLQAFRILREAYYTQLELKGDRNDPEVKEWLEWRQRCKGTNTSSNKNNLSSTPKSNISQSSNTTTTSSSVLAHVNRSPAAFSHLLAATNSAPTNVISSQQSNHITTTLSPVNIALKSHAAVGNSIAGVGGIVTTGSSSIGVSPTVTNQQLPTLPTSGTVQQQTTVVTAAPTPQRGLSALAVAVRQQHLQQQQLLQQQQQQQQQQQILANLVTTIAQVSANAFVTTVTAGQQQNTSTAAQVVATSARLVIVS